MTTKDIQELIRLVNRYNLSEFKLRDGDFELTLRSESFSKASRKEVVPSVIPIQSSIPAVQTVPVAAAAQPARSEGSPQAGTEAEASDANLVEIKSPMVGTFYRSPAPEKPAYIKVGDSVDNGQVVCIIEAMKLFNEIESEVKGKVVKIMVDDASPVEYEQVLFLVDPNA